MTPKKKAIQLRDKFYQASLCTISGTATIFYQNAKNLALIAVNEILPSATFIDAFQQPYREEGDTVWVDYWNEVKKEIEKL